MLRMPQTDSMEILKSCDYLSSYRESMIVSLGHMMGHI